MGQHRDYWCLRRATEADYLAGLSASGVPIFRADPENALIYPNKARAASEALALLDGAPNELGWQLEVCTWPGR